MSVRFRLYPTPEQVTVFQRHCADSRFIWNLCVEQQSWWRRGRGPTPSGLERSRQLTEARAEFEWLREGARNTQKHALRDFDQALAKYFSGKAKKPRWHIRDRHESFGTCGAPIRNITKRYAEIGLPKCGYVRIRLSQSLPERIGTLRVTCDQAGRWHIVFLSALDPVERIGTGAVIGIDRGVKTAVATSDGQMFRVPRLSDRDAERYLALQRKHALTEKKSARRERYRRKMARTTQTLKDRRKDWVEKTTTRLVTDYDVIVVEKLDIKNMTKSARGTVEEPGTNVRAKAGLNRAILASCWGLFNRRLKEKAAQRGVTLVEVDPRYTSQQCRVCGHTARENRESQAVFRCVSCGHLDHADRNAACNILARGLENLAPDPGYGFTRAVA